MEKRYSNTNTVQKIWDCFNFFFLGLLFDEKMKKKSEDDEEMVNNIKCW
jgi:hypothetical protein